MHVHVASRGPGVSPRRHVPLVHVHTTLSTTWRRGREGHVGTARRASASLQYVEFFSTPSMHQLQYFLLRVYIWPSHFFLDATSGIWSQAVETE
jgi:hypothetical protein